MVGAISTNLNEDPKDEKVRLKMLENTLKSKQYLTMSRFTVGEISECYSFDAGF